MSKQTKPVLYNLQCKEASCIAQGLKKYNGYCLDHFKAKEYADLRIKKADIQRFSLMGFTPEEVEELAKVDLSEVYKLQAELEKEITPLLRMEIQERLVVIANKVTLAHELRCNELWIHARTSGDVKNKIAALKQLQVEEAHYVNLMQQLGQIPKVADKLELTENTAEQLVDKVEGRVIDIPSERIVINQVFSDEQEMLIKRAMQVDI